LSRLKIVTLGLRVAERSSCRRTVTSNNRLASSVSNVSYLHNPGSEPLVYATIGQALEATAHRFPGRVAVRSVYQDVTLTYEQLLSQADALGCALRDRGLEKGDRIGIWSHNNAEWIVALVAAARVGLISVALNPVYEKPELKYCINKTELKAIIIGDTLKHANYYKVIEDLIPEVRRDIAGSIESKEFPSLKCIITCDKDVLPGTFTFKSLVTNKQDSSRYGFQVEPDDGSIIHFTSGTTGEPKAALDSHFGVVNNSYFLGKRQKLNEGHPVTCIQSPLFHALGSIITAAAALRHGASLVLPAPSYSVSANMHALMAEKCTIITGTPTMYVDLVTLVRSAGVTPRLRDALNAGAPCSPQLIRDIKQFLNAETVSSLFGMTETTAAVFQSLPNDNTELVAETVGYIQDHIETKVVDDEGKTVPFGSPGELLVRGYSTMMGYWGEPEKTRKTLGADGWLHTGDKFTLNEDGYGRIVGRLKDIIVRGGENIAPKEIEDLLNTHPDIVESQVVGVSDERLGEELCAVVRLREGASLTPQDVQRHCTGRLAKFKIPRILKFAEEFPKTVSGKIQKYKLRDLIESGKL
ncbi:medium-chain acyl-CoA ligase ACSF2, mitochondrial-like, partial [Choristoneura fumiferana]|uniref:medium-chain acyl-CoA ligase ACSF2, mitochondrial-like n=1 Tax=Choristoneura fumiferana TaxID=7141 RepID=UPI003D155772